MKIIGFSFLFICFSLKSQIQTSNQQWVQYYAQFEVNKKWNVTSDIGFRWQNRFRDKASYILRAGVGYNFNSCLRFVVGFGHQGSFDSNSLSRMEFRPFQEIGYKNSRGSIKMDHRWRLEERFFNGYEENHLQHPNSFHWRFRYQFLLNFPIWKFSTQNQDRYLSLTLRNELFIKYGKGLHSIFDQNRTIIGPTLHVNERFAFSVHYNGQFGLDANQKSTYSSVFWFTIQQKFAIKKN